MKKIKLLIVDDSSVMRNVLAALLRKYPDIEITGMAADPYEAREIILNKKPDVLTLDIEMPRMNGLDFIAVLMKHYPLPVVVVSSQINGNCETSLKALEIGAVDVFPKPGGNISSKIEVLTEALYKKIVNAARSNISSFCIKGTKCVFSPDEIPVTEKIVAIGASTGGTEAIRSILEFLPRNFPPVVITQHMPAGFTNSFARRLNTICRDITVKEAGGDECLCSGEVLIAPGDSHMMIIRDGEYLKTLIRKGPRVNGHIPSVDVLFSSVSESAGANVVGILLTGMGSDGADGMFKMRQKGALTIAQSEQSCVVFGMPKMAIERGGAELICDLEDIPGAIITALKRK